VIVHIWAFHTTGNNNPTGVEVRRTSRADAEKDTLPFWPYFVIKDLFALVFVLVVFAAIVGFMPNFLGHPDNYIEANALKTPTHIVPEWYFLPFYAMLRAITFDILWINSKLAGVLTMFGSIALLLLLPWLDTSRVRSGRYRPMFKVWFWLLVVDFVLLIWCGSQPPAQPFVIISQLATLYWFVFFLVIMPILGVVEKPLPVPETIEADFKAHYGTGEEGMARAAFSNPAE
jgi:ubiquinol-cytochrome c reductase cytochrome b subunit